MEETRFHVPIVISLLVVNADAEADWRLGSFEDGVRCKLALAYFHQCDVL